MENLFVKKNPLQDFLSSLNAVISTNGKNLILTGHVTFKLPCNQIYQMKTPQYSNKIKHDSLNSKNLFACSQHLDFKTPAGCYYNLFISHKLFKENGHQKKRYLPSSRILKTLTLFRGG